MKEVSAVDYPAMKTEKLFWSAHSKTERTERQQQLITTIADITIRKLVSNRTIK